MIYARIEAELVVELIDVPDDDIPLTERFPPELLARLQPATAEVQRGWVFWNGAFQPPRPPGEEQLGRDARARRDALLAACDWTQTADAPLSAERNAAWRSYRKALRDLTDQPGWPRDIAWPAQPGQE
jgi:hypothetical protein